MTTHEMGGIDEERRVLAMFGFTRPTNTTYLRALEAKLAGKNQTEVARAFLAASLRTEGSLTDDEYNEKAKIAGRNILRLYRRGGNDSQALDYLEQTLMLRGMARLPEEQIRAIAIVGTAFSLPDAAALHAVDLLHIPPRTDHRPAQDVVALFRQKYL